jgi:outer membrane protein assembly factor BamE (lipoprotein component of BamABCDE complex)
MPMLKLRSTLLWFAILSLSGCVGENNGAASVDVGNVDVGMTQNQVLSILGEPRKREAYGATEFLFYSSSSGSNIPIAIVNGKVTSIGRAAYDIVVRSKAQSDSAAPFARKREAP